VEGNRAELLQMAVHELTIQQPEAADLQPRDQLDQCDF